MFDRLHDQPADKIIAMIQAFRADPRDDKVDLGVGVYKDASGVTPVMRAVKAAEARILEAQTTKVYTTLAGDPDFVELLSDLVLGPDGQKDRRAAVATPGGTGAIRQGLELARLANPGVRVFVSDPTWPNHLSILKYLGIETVPYRYFDDTTRGVDVAGMMEDLSRVRPGDVVLLHGCCHNPTGANLTRDDWAALSAHLEATGAVPFVDIAYQGFGDGLDEDAAGLRLMAGQVPEMIVAASCSKNFGIYRERTGLLLALGDTAGRARLQDNLTFLNRQNYSFPPDHGARIVQTILASDVLRADWETELAEMRTGMFALRQALADELRRRTNSDRFDFIAQHRGMFSRIGAGPEQVTAMREEHGIYMVGDSRINVAGLSERTIPRLADAMIATGV